MKCGRLVGLGRRGLSDKTTFKSFSQYCVLTVRMKIYSTKINGDNVNICSCNFAMCNLSV